MDTPSDRPGFSPSQIAYLERIFPNRCARKGMTLEEIWMDAGARMVVDHLKSFNGNLRASAEDLNLEAEALAPVRAARRR